jgi:hypothetical protein
MTDPPEGNILSTSLECVRQVLIQNGSIDESVASSDLFNAYIGRHPEIVSSDMEKLYEVLAGIARERGLRAEVHNWWSWRRVRISVKSGRPTVVLVMGIWFGIPFGGARVWKSPWQSVLVTRMDGFGPFTRVHVYDPNRQGSASNRRLPLFVFKYSRSRGMGSVLMWRYLWLKTDQMRTRVPFPWTCLQLK